jgi:hypothetical protein
LANSCRLADAHHRIKVLESLLATTYLAHPKLVDWAMRNKSAFQGADMAKAFLQGSEQLQEEKQVQTLMQPVLKVICSQLPAVLGLNTDKLVKLHAQKVEKLRQQRDQWRARAHKFKDICKDLQKQLQSVQPLQGTAAEHFLVCVLLAQLILQRCCPQ